jgi:ABC-type multidrug transport system permease subunit
MNPVIFTLFIIASVCCYFILKFARRQFEVFDERLNALFESEDIHE